ncbi:Sec-independent protein translocase subunit TatA [Teredinibacter franksiae]|uniref:Sec-independent protein translocase subunit TatA n=1 Tax=Teredinibacter franksiae TaxID=2761453 RepID=UPI0016282E6A|nr:Sec-independent protein translocase subunit TatA [Teredinibacter franksiae]
MGLGGISIWQLLIILVIVLLLFGTKRLRGLGGDLGGAIKGFKKAMTDEEAKAKAEEDAKQVEAEQSETADTTTECKEKTESK